MNQITFDAFFLLRPYWLMALPLILVAALWMRKQRRAGAWSGVIDPQLLPSLRQLGLLSDARHDASAVLPFLAAGALALGLSGPALPRQGVVEYRAMDPLILTMDLSPSVASDDLALAQAKTAAGTLLQLADGRPVGIMVYAADAYMASAPTTDAAALSGMIAVMAQDTMPVAGSRPDMALSMARDLFDGGEGSGIGGADFVVISDGGGSGPRAIEEAARLAGNQARVWALWLDHDKTTSPAPVPEQLEAMAEAGGGEAMPASDAATLMDHIIKTRQQRLSRQDATGQGYVDLGPYLLIFALLAVFPLFRRRG